MPKRLAWSCALLVASTSVFAQPKGTSAPPEPSLWDHNGSVVSLVAQGSAREFRYKEPRSGMLEAGARPGLVLFRGKVENGLYSGLAFMFDRRCGQVSYAVSGPILDNDQRVVLTGEAPLVGAKCRVQGYFTEVLEFRLQNAIKTARTEVPESAPSPPLQSEERAAPPSPPPPARELQAASPHPPAVAADHAPAQQVAVAPPPPPPIPNPPPAAADHAPAPKQAAAPPPPPMAAKPDLTAEIERARAAREQAAAAAEAALAAERAAQRVFAEAEATRAAAEARLQQSRADLNAAREENSEERSRQTLILVAMTWTLLLSGAAIVLLIIRLRRSQSLREAENASTAGAAAATAASPPPHSRWSEIVANAGALGASNAAKSHGYQSGGRMRVFFQTRPAHH